MKTSRFTLTAIVRRQAPACGLLRALVAVLTIVLVGNSIAYGQTPASPNATKQTLLELGISKHVKVKEVDGTTVKGTLTSVDADSFQVIPGDGASPIVIAYSQVVKIVRGGVPLAVKVVLWTIVGGIVILILGSILAFHH
jgi:hypothetical protein